MNEIRTPEALKAVLLKFGTFRDVPHFCCGRVERLCFLHITYT